MRLCFRRKEKSDLIVIPKKHACKYFFYRFFSNTLFLEPAKSLNLRYWRPYRILKLHFEKNFIKKKAVFFV